MKQSVKGLDSRKLKKPLKKKIDNHPNQSVDLKDLPLPKPKRTLEEAQKEYRKENKNCEFAKKQMELAFEKEYTMLWCMIKDEYREEPCKFYQVKGE